MVLLRSGKDVPYLGKKIPKRKQKQKENQQENRSKSEQQFNSSTLIEENTQEASQNTSRSSVSSTESIERSSLAVGDSSMLSGSDQSTMLDDTLEITDLDESNQSLSNSRLSKEQPYYESISKSNITIDDTMNETESNMCGVADLSWF